MTPLIRIITFTLVLLLALLVAASASRWYVGAKVRAGSMTSTVPFDSRAAHALLDRGTLALSGSALIVVVLLIFSLGLRSQAEEGTRAPFSSRERERRSLALLASTSAKAQEQLDHERDEREKAQADAKARLELLNQVLEEKIRLGRDLHDGVIQSLYAAGLTLESAGRLEKSHPEKAHEYFDKTLGLINRGITDVRSYIEGLSPRSVRRDSLASGLAEAVEQLRAGRPLDVDWKIDNSTVAELSDEQISETLQITREAASNALRHGGAHRLTISLSNGQSGAEFIFRDDGTGFDPGVGSPSGQGIKNMAARAESATGTFKLSSTLGTGTCLQINWQTARSS